MPWAAPRPCPVCKIVDCKNPEHGKNRRYDKHRPSGSARGYDWTWTKFARRYLQEHPLCVMCEKEGRVEAAEMVDHIIPVHGPDDPLFYDPSNLQSLSHRCHRIKTADDVKKGLTR